MSQQQPTVVVNVPGFWVSLFPPESDQPVLTEFRLTKDDAEIRAEALRSELIAAGAERKVQNLRTRNFWVDCSNKIIIDHLPTTEVGYEDSPIQYPVIKITGERKEQQKTEMYTVEQLRSVVCECRVCVPLHKDIVEKLVEHVEYVWANDEMISVKLWKALADRGSEVPSDLLANIKSVRSPVTRMLSCLSDTWKVSVTPAVTTKDLSLLERIHVMREAEQKTPLPTDMKLMMACVPDRAGIRPLSVIEKLMELGVNNESKHGKSSKPMFTKKKSTKNKGKK